MIVQSWVFILELVEVLHVVIVQILHVVVVVVVEKCEDVGATV